ncbi:hypothetical protein ACFIOY_08180 [Bradyrhizobium sp. TZ2]
MQTCAKIVSESPHEIPQSIDIHGVARAVVEHLPLRAIVGAKGPQRAAPKSMSLTAPASDASGKSELFDLIRANELHGTLLALVEGLERQGPRRGVLRGSLMLCRSCRITADELNAVAKNLGLFFDAATQQSMEGRAAADGRATMIANE